MPGQMAEGSAREFGRGLYEVHIAGLLATKVQPRAIAVMKEAGSISLVNMQRGDQ